MARFAGGGLNLSDFSLDVSSGVTGAAGGGAKVGQAFQAARKNSGFRPDEIHGAGIGLRSKEKQAAMGIDAEMAASKNGLEAKVEATEMVTEAQKNAYNKQGQGAMMQGAFGAIASIGAGLLSDESTKNTIEPLENALATLRQLKPVSFYYNEEYSSAPERLHHGFIAQEYRKVLPDATYFDEDKQKLCIDTSDVIAILVRAVQQLETRLTYLEAVNALEGARA